MPNQNPYLIENKKPVEEVREIPTYQPKYTDEEIAKLKEIFVAEQKEAIKKYQIKTSPLSPEARSKVIRKWGDGYVSENREGYGPCYKNCGWNNPHCSYQSWMYLKVPCPAKECPDEGRGTTYYWVHATDGGDIKISDCANMKCVSCGTVHHMKDWFFKCPKHVAKHQGDKKYWKVELDSFEIALNSVFRTSGDPEIMKKLRHHMIEHDDEWR